MLLACQARNIELSTPNSQNQVSELSTSPSAASSQFLCKMQKVIQRTVQAEKQAARRFAKKKAINAHAWAKTNREQELHKHRDLSRTKREARVARKEDWELGPLAPRRDVGLAKDTYGTVSTYRLRGKELAFEEKEEALAPFGGRWLNIVKGDRVVLLEGRDKGQIGEISAVDASRVECTVKGLNMVCLESALRLNWQS